MALVDGLHGISRLEVWNWSTGYMELVDWLHELGGVGGG
jgi:hypothetical protein